MTIWFYLFLIVLCLSIFLILKIIIMKNEINNIGKSISSIINTDTNNLITISTNDSELKKLANVLNKSLKELRQLELEYKNGNQELKSSITNISHDLRTPLTAIRGYLDLMDNNNLTEKQIKYLKIIDSKVNDLTELTEQLFDFSKCIDIQNEIKKENICINDILEDSLASFYSLFKEHNITPNIDICKDKVIRLLNENMLKRLQEQIFVVACTPLLSDSSFSSNSSGVAIQFKLFSMEKSVQLKENIFRAGFNRMFNLIRDMINLYERKDYTEDDTIIQTFTRSLPMDLSALADSISKLNGVVSRRTLMSQLEFVSDATLEENQLRTEQEEAMEMEAKKAKMMFEATPQPTIAPKSNNDEPIKNIVQNKQNNN